MKRSQIKFLLAIFLIISSVFSHLFFLPKLGYKLQFTEIVFLSIFVFLVWNNKLLLKRKLFDLDKIFLYLVFLLLINFIFHPLSNVALIIIQSLYLLSVYFVFSTLLLSQEHQVIKKVLENAADYGLWILIVIGFVGFGLYYLFDYSRFVLIYHQYPYFGDVFRIKGFSYSPNLYISLLCFFTCLKVAFSKFNYSYFFIVLALGLMSLTKEAIILIVILFCLKFFKNIKYNKWKVLLISITGLVYIFLSFFIVSIKSQSLSVNLNKSKVQVKAPVYENDIFKLYSTTYFEVFKNGIKISLENPIKGVGIGNFQNELSKYQERGLYPKYFQTYQAVDSFFGYAAQLGLFYFIFILGLILIIIKSMKRMPNHIIFPFTLYLLYMFFESMALGTFYFRHYYIYFGILLTLSNYQKEETKVVKI